MAGLAEEIALSLGAPSCRVYRQGRDRCRWRCRARTRETVRLLRLCQRLAREGPRGPETVPPVTAVLGLDQEGVPLLLRLPSPNVAHVLIAGTTGSGKTALARAMVASLAMHNHQRDAAGGAGRPQGPGVDCPLRGCPTCWCRW